MNVDVHWGVELYAAHQLRQMTRAAGQFGREEMRPQALWRAKE
jgi:hypothetical protein